MRLSIGHDLATVSVVTLNGEEVRPMTQEEIDIHNSECDELDVWIDEEKYKSDRETSYPSIGDQLDALWKGGDAAAAMKVIVDKVKTDYPKP